MKITFKYTQEQFSELLQTSQPFSQNSRREKEWLGKIVNIGFYVVCALLIAFLFTNKTHLVGLDLFVASFIAIVACFTRLSLISKKEIKTYLQEPTNLFCGEISIELTNDQFIATYAWGHTVLQLKKIGIVYISKNFVYIEFDPLTIISVPLTAFPTSNDKNQFLQKLGCKKMEYI